MVATTPTAGAIAPWTVISQGSALTYEQATGLDKLEFAQRSQGPALSRLLHDDGYVKGATVRGDCLCRWWVGRTALVSLVSGGGLFSHVGVYSCWRYWWL